MSKTAHDRLEIVGLLAGIVACIAALIWILTPIANADPCAGVDRSVAVDGWCWPDSY